MINIIGALCFLILSFLTWLSVSFKCASYFINENIIFGKQNRAIWFYFINISVSIVMTIFCYCLICIIQERI